VRPCRLKKSYVFAAVLPLLSVCVAGPAQAVAGTRYSFATGSAIQAHLTASTSSPVALAPGTIATSYLVTASSASALGAIRLQPCAAAYGAGDSVFSIDVGDVVSNLIQVTAAGMCLKSNVPVDVAVGAIATAGAAGTFGYSALGAPVTVFSGTASTVAAPLNLAAAALPGGVAELSLIIDAAGGSISFHECGRSIAPPAVSAIGGTTTTMFVPQFANGVCVSSLAGLVDLTVRVNGAFAAATAPGALAKTYVFDIIAQSAPGFVPITPTRLFDTRSTTQREAGTVYRYDFNSVVPAAARAVTMNVTAVNATGAGFVTVFPCADGQPTASNLNVTAGVTVPNLVTVGLGSTRAVCFFTSVATHLLADLAGWYERGAGSGFRAQNPVRLFDTRSGLRIEGGATYVLDVSGRVAGSPTAVSLNATVVDAGGNGFVTVYPCDDGLPTASNLNFVTGQTVANSVVVKLGASKRLCFYSSAPTHMLADLAGVYSASESVGFFDTTPTRLVDTRGGGVAVCNIRGQIGCNAGVVDAKVLDVAISGDPVAVTFNATVTRAIGSGFITAYPCDKPRPTSSNLNFSDGDTVPNLVTVSASATGHVCFFISASETGSVHLIVDLAGTFSARTLVDSRPRLV
jgi:hypothetical protein